MNSGQT